MNAIDGFVSLNEHKKSGLSIRAFEREIFKAGFTPLRFKRNQNTIAQNEQFKLFSSHVAIVGCGGLGGSVSESLARIGVGKMTLIDSDRFCEHNLNRQNFSSIKNLDKPKVKVLKNELRFINPALKIKKHFKSLNEPNISKLLKNADVVIDCVDDIKTKKLLASWCKKNSKKFIHGAIGGKVLQITDSTDLKNIYKSNDSGAESICGNLVMTAQNCASLQALLCVNMLLDKNFSFEELLFCDLSDFEFVRLPI